MPASFGFHPALHWPLPFGAARAAHRILFEAPEPAPVRRIDGNGFLLPDPVATPVVGDTLTLRDDLFVDDALIFDRLTSRSVSYGAFAGPQFRSDFDDFPTLGVWTKPGADFICIEPLARPLRSGRLCRRHPRQAWHLRDRTGGTRTLSMRITLEDASLG